MIKRSSGFCWRGLCIKASGWGKGPVALWGVKLAEEQLRSDKEGSIYGENRYYMRKI